MLDHYDLRIGMMNSREYVLIEVFDRDAVPGMRMAVNRFSLG
jgi:hypothetical protein